MVLGIEPWGVVTGVLGLLTLTLVRLLSERRMRFGMLTRRSVRRESKMESKKRSSKDKPRLFWQFWRKPFGRAALG